MLCYLYVTGNVHLINLERFLCFEMFIWNIMRIVAFELYWYN